MILRKFQIAIPKLWFWVQIVQELSAEVVPGDALHKPSYAQGWS